MLGISNVRFPGVRCIKKNAKSLIGVVSSDGAFLAITFVIFLFLLISLSFRRLVFGTYNHFENTDIIQSNDKHSWPIVSQKQLMEFQSPGKFERYTYNYHSIAS